MPLFFKRPQDSQQIKGKQPLICPAQMELRGFTRSLGELQWLLLTLVLLYSQTPNATIDSFSVLFLAMVAFFLFVLGFRYLNFFITAKRWKLAIEIVAMVVFISVASWYTGGNASPLVNAYLLILIASALTLGKMLTMLLVLLIAFIYLFMAYALHGVALFSLVMFTDLMVRFTPLLLVAYLTTMLAADINFAKQLLAEESYRDEMTGLLNMRGFKKMLDQEIARAQRYGHPLTLMLVDSDKLKATNDRHGHEAGNCLIRMVAETIHLGLRSTDTLARFGGDEFILLLPETSQDRAKVVGERIRKAVANASTTFNGSRLTATVSIGAAVTGQDLTTRDDLMQVADRALYVSKRAGRNLVTLYGSWQELHREAGADGSGRHGDQAS